MTNDFLSGIIQVKKERLQDAIRRRPIEVVIADARAKRQSARKQALSNALQGGDNLKIIAEFKRQSPSKGVIRADVNAGEVAVLYESGGAAAISVLTEVDHFGGSLDDLTAIRQTVSIPILRKDFIFDDYQIYEAAAAGADALLLIVAALSDSQLERLRTLTEAELGMDALVEVHTEAELRRARASGARLLGVNNRDLHTFTVSLDTSVQLARFAADDIVMIAESGLKTRADLEMLHELGYRGFLIGESLMRAEDPRAALRALAR